jgi:hypothetical protein
MKLHGWIVAGLLVALAGCSTAQTRGQAADEPEAPADDLSKLVKTIGDITEVGDSAVTPLQLSGVGLVYGLDNTGGSPPPSEWRQMLEDQLHKQGVEDVKAMLNSPRYAMVFVTAFLMPGVRKGEPIDVEVTLPPGSKATSLRGGRLLDCALRNYETTRALKPDCPTSGLLTGHILGKARGPLLVGFGEGDEEVGLRRGRIWEGGESLADLPFYLYLKDDQCFARVANEIATRINAAFPDDPVRQARVQQTRKLLVLDEMTSQINQKFPGGATGNGETAHAVNKGVVHVKVPFEYRLCPERYLRVLRLVPLHEQAEDAAKYRHALQAALLEPKDTIRAALRMEALGKESVPALKKGLASSHELVRFAAAEALTYLGSNAGIDELARLAEEHEVLRSHCLTAIASQDGSLPQMTFARLLSSPTPQLRYGAFRALLTINPMYEPIKGQLIHEAFWLHHVAPRSVSMVHLSTSRRAEVVVFGDTPALAPPFRFDFGTEFILSAEETDTRCTVSRFARQTNPPHIARKQCSFELEDVLRMVAELGGGYPEVADLLRQVDRHKCLNCSLLVNALPTATPVTLLAAAGGSLDQLKDSPEFQREVQAAQQDLATSSRERDGGFQQATHRPPGGE